jgi:hypothetical protein
MECMVSSEGCLSKRHVRFGSLADMATSQCDVRFSNIPIGVSVEGGLRIRESVKAATTFAVSWVHPSPTISSSKFFSACAKAPIELRNPERRRDRALE